MSVIGRWGVSSTGGGWIWIGCDAWRGAWAGIAWRKSGFVCVGEAGVWQGSESVGSVCEGIAGPVVGEEGEGC